MWRSKILLKPDERLHLERSWSSGFMLEQDNELYIIFNMDDIKTGEIIVTDHTAVKGFKRSCRVVQTDVDGRVVMDASFDPE